MILTLLIALIAILLLVCGQTLLKLGLNDIGGISLFDGNPVGSLLLYLHVGHWGLFHNEPDLRGRLFQTQHFHHNHDSTSQQQNREYTLHRL